MTQWPIENRLHIVATTPADSIITPVASEEAALVPDAVPVKKIPKRFVAFPFEVRTS